MKNYFFKLNDFIFESGFEIKLAETQDELESAYRLLHDCYVHQGRIKPNKSGLFCQGYHFHPETVTVVVKYRSGVVGTVSLIKDTVLDLDADQFYPEELAKLRSRGNRVVAATSLAVTRHFRNKNAIITHLLMKYIYLYSSRYLGASHVILLCHPSKASFYTNFWKFTSLGPSLKYRSSENGEIQGLCMPLSAEQIVKITQNFNSTELNQNLGIFLNHVDERFKFPKRSVGQVVDLIMTPELLEYFFIKKTNIYEELSLSVRKMFLEIYVQLFGAQRMTKFLNLGKDFKLREYRMPVLTQSGIRVGNQYGLGKILDISTQGCFVQIPSQLEDHLRIHTDDILLSFRLGEHAYEVQGHVIWKNQGNQQRYPKGIGVKFTEQITQINAEFLSWTKTFDFDRTQFFAA